MTPKLRAWDKDLEQMIYQGDDDYDFILTENGLEVIDEQTKTTINSENMQFTGLFDKNGKEIYEGDILRLKNSLDLIDYNALIMFKDGGFCAIDGTEDNYVVSRYRLSDFDLEITVLGNIYEDPELIKEQEE